MNEFPYRRYIAEHRNKSFLLPELDSVTHTSLNAINTSFGHCIKTIRRQKGLSYSDLVEGTGVNAKEIEYIESGYGTASNELLFFIEEKLNLDLYPILYSCITLAQKRFSTVTVSETREPETMENKGTLVFDNEVFENVELSYITPANHNVKFPEVFVCRTREEGTDTFYTIIAYMAYPDLYLYNNCLTFSGMVPVDFVRKEEITLTSFSRYRHYEPGEFRFYPYQPDYR